jgi:hypothetical protein
VWIGHIAALAERSWPAVDHIEAIDRKNRLNAEVAPIFHNNRIPASLLTHDEPPVAVHCQQHNESEYALSNLFSF